MRKLLLTTLIVALSACEGEGTPADATGDIGLDVDPSACECEHPGKKRCAGDVIEICSGGSWREESRCASPKTCFTAQCFEPTTACPTAIRYDGFTELAERLAPTQIGECVAGGELGLDMTLQEPSAARQQRSIIILFPNGCPEPTLDFDAAFGFDVDSLITSQAPALSLAIPPNTTGAFFRQTTRLRHVGLLMVGDEVAGTVLVTDYQFDYAATSGESCPLQSNLPPALPLQSSCAWHEYGCAPCGP
ncbi:MAG: hypothetical protein JRH20_18940 [Deltaproteobacteria bacterium]|nr:hypothetical protein [Deltaproteobacteria bacterium]